MSQEPEREAHVPPLLSLRLLRRLTAIFAG